MGLYQLPVAWRSCRHGEIHEIWEGCPCPAWALCRAQGYHCEEPRRWHPRQAVRALPCGWNRPLPKEGDEEDGQEEGQGPVQDEGLHEGHELQPPHAHQVLS